MNEFEFDEPIKRGEFWELHGKVAKLYPDYTQAEAIYNKLHRCYYGAYVRKFNIKPPQHLIEGSRRAALAGDWHLNSPYTSICDWDVLVPQLALVPGLKATMRLKGDALDQMAGVCILKEAMRQYLEREFTQESKEGTNAITSAD